MDTLTLAEKTAYLSILYILICAGGEKKEERCLSVEKDDWYIRAVSDSASVPQPVRLLSAEPL